MFEWLRMKKQIDMKKVADRSATTKINHTYVNNRFSFSAIHINIDAECVARTHTYPIRIASIFINFDENRTYAHMIYLANHNEFY